MRDVNNGWIVRYAHANVASFFFIFVYAPLSFIKLYLNFCVFFLLLKTNLNNYVIKNLFINLNYFKSLLINYFHFFNVNKVIKSSLNIIQSLFLSKDKNSTLPLAKVNKLKKIDDPFLQWFVGFSDAEACFIINIKNKTEVHFIFQITLHIDDIVTLYTIREKLDIGVVTIKGNTCSFRVHSFSILINSIIPIFDQYPLLTHKQLDYRDWKKAIFLKKDNQELARSLTTETLKKINIIQSGINSSRFNYEGYVLNKNMISKYWLLGFIEGDGTFYFSNSTVVFGITQKDRQILDVISEYLQNLPLLPLYDELFVPKKPNCIIKNNKKAYQLVITDKDVLFQYIFPFFQNLQFYSRKKIDFIIWSIGLFLFIQGYINTSKGKNMLLKLSNNMNSKRYFSNIFDIFDGEEIEELFKTEPPFNIRSGKSHFILTKEYSQLIGSRSGFKVHIYKNGLLPYGELEIKGSPFSSYTKGGKAIGLKSVSSIANYIDTGKIYKEGYTFYSIPCKDHPMVVFDKDK
jgi:hypothetical protein